jgi:hypothetical protein
MPIELLAVCPNVARRSLPSHTKPDDHELIIISSTVLLVRTTLPAGTTAGIDFDIEVQARQLS